MSFTQFKILLHKFHHHSSEELAPDIRDYIEYSGYPRNHTFFICDKQLLPTYKLSQRYQKIARLYPTPLESFLDLSCCRGFFIFSSAQDIYCQRSLGIDVDPVNIEACRALKTYLNMDKPQFELLTLETLSEQIQNFGGPFQTVLLANTYQYLFFGSDQWPGYLSHDTIFAYLNKICSDSIIFSNRTEVSECQNKLQIQQAGNIVRQYNSDALMTAAEKYFEVIPHKKIGRYPLWLLRRRKNTFEV
jgi:hypothetical protein